MDWKRNGWPDAKFEVTSAKCDLRNEQQREKREESTERREKREASREEVPSSLWPGGMVPKRISHSEQEGRAQREARRERQAR